MMMDDDIQTWWEIPAIVHFCEVFTLITNDISKIDINEFEYAVEENSYLLTDMAIRFTKICGFYDPNTNEWWNIMKKEFQSKCIVYNFKYPLDSATYFDDLTRKQKVEALYVYCNIILDVNHIQNKLSNNSNILHMLNVKPLGYDLNNSVYWYFGTNKLYREDFEDSFDLPTNLPVEHDVHGKIPYKHNPSGVFGSGKWYTICDNIDNFYSLADITEDSKNKNIRYLHKAISNIILNLPKVKKKKSCYTYIKPLRSICTRSLRSVDVMNAKCKKLNLNSSFIQDKQHSEHVMENQKKHRSLATNVAINDIFQNKKLNNKPALKLQRSGNEKLFGLYAKNNIKFERVLSVKIVRCDL